MTSDATLRIFIPVLDAPQHLLLHASLDLFSAIAVDSLTISTYSTELASVSNIFWLDGDVLSKVFLRALSKRQNSVESDTLFERIKQLEDEDWEFFVRVLKDGSVVMSVLSVRTEFVFCSSEKVTIYRVLIENLLLSLDSLSY